MKIDNKIYERYLEGERLPNYKTLSGIDLKECYQASDIKLEGESPGEFPYTRGIHPEMYRKRIWTRRQQSGFGLPEESNQRMIFLLQHGMTGLNLDPDNPTKVGIDADHPLAEGEVGLQGTSFSTWEDMDILFGNIPMEKVSSTLIVNSPISGIILSMYLLVAKKRGIPIDSLRGTIMNCAITQLIGPTYQSITHFYPIDLAMKISCDVIEYSSKYMPHWNNININAYNMREYCIDAIQEAAFAFTLAEDYIKLMIKRGLGIDDFAGRMAFFTSAHIDFLEEIAKLRAMRRLWAKLLRERFGAKEERSCLFRTAIQTSGLVLTAQEPLNNIVRATIQTLAAVLGGAQSIHTTGYDEAYSLPTEESHKLSLRTQQIVAFETNVCKTVDPFGGSYAIEWLTDKLEEEILALMDRIDSMGGFLQCFKNGWIEDQINESRNKWAKDLEEGEMLRVGVNIFDETKEEARIDIFHHSPDAEEKRRRYVQNYKKNRNQNETQYRLDQLYQRVKNEPETCCIPLIMDALEAKATSGEIADILRKAYDFELIM